MSQSPGHRKWPDHRVDERRIEHRMQVAVGDEIIADSNDVVKVEEDNHPDRFYFPRADVNEAALERTAKTSECPFKGKASYFAIHAGGEHLEDAAWSYEDPYEEHAELRGRLAFYTDNAPGLEIRDAPS